MIHARSQRLSVAIIISLVLLLFGMSSSVAEEKYPQYLTAKEITAHFLQYPSVVAEQDAREMTLSIDGNTAHRLCDECNTDNSIAQVSYPAQSNQICINWQYVRFPTSGCFTLTRTGDRYFKLQKVGSSMSIDYKVTSQPRLAADVLASKKTLKATHFRAILVDLSLKKPEPNAVRSAIEFALNNRGWKIESGSDKKFIIANLLKNDKIYKVKIEYRKPWIAVGFIEGFHANRDSWLRNIEKDLLHSLAMRK